MATGLPTGGSLGSEDLAKVQQSLKAQARDAPGGKREIAFAPASTAEDEAIVARLTGLINTAYATEEGGFWSDGFVRTSTDEVRQYIRAGELAIAWRQPNSPSQPPSSEPPDIMGCVRTLLLDARTGEFGLLVCDPAFRGSGIGRDLLRFAEDSIRKRGGGVMQLELLVGDGWTHPLKERLGKWYERVGYKLVRTGSVAEAFPRLAPMMARPSLFRVYQKVLSLQIGKPES